MRFLTRKRSSPIPILSPPQTPNQEHYIVSLSCFISWVHSIAEEAGVKIYTFGFASASLFFSDGGTVQGVITNDLGIDKNNGLKDSFEPGMLFRAKTTLLAEGAHGSLSKVAIKKYDLRKDCSPQTYGIGVKEVWKVSPDQYRKGEVIHTLGWPLDYKTYGGGWVYHMDDGLVSLGLVLGLDYTNPYISPYRELQVSIFDCFLLWFDALMSALK